MAGMLPGVEFARRRRFHQNRGSLDQSSGFGTQGWTRRSSFCLNKSSNETHHTTTASSLQRSILNQAYQDQKMGVEATEAKERLDERLRILREAEPKRQYRGKRELRRGDRKNCVVQGELLQMEVYGGKKESNGSRKLKRWTKILSWKGSDEEDECPVCLERLRVGEILVYLPCAHRFHSGCLVPWLENNAHCPCCRMGIIPL